MKRSRLRPVNRERRDRLREEMFGSEFIEWIRLRPCGVCSESPPSDPHHVRSRAAGGRNDSNVAPLCRVCHTRVHQLGKLTFRSRTGVNLEDVAREEWAIWKEKGEADGTEGNEV